MRRSPPKIGQTATKAAKKGRKSLEMTPQPPQTALKRQHRRSRRRCSDVPLLDKADAKVFICPVVNVMAFSKIGNGWVVNKIF